MNYSSVAALISDDVQGVAVNFQSSDKDYVYKNLIPDLKEGDLVVVPALWPDKKEVKFSVATVVEVDVELDYDKPQGFVYRWIVQKVDLEQYEVTMEREQEILVTVKKAEKKKKRKELAGGLMEFLPEKFVGLTFFDNKTTEEETTDD